MLFLESDVTSSSQLEIKWNNAGEVLVFRQQFSYLETEAESRSTPSSFILHWMCWITKQEMFESHCIFYRLRSLLQKTLLYLTN